MLHPTIDDTIALATRLHAGQRDKQGVPYIAHPLSMMRMVRREAWHVAVLHDSIEDGTITAGELLAIGYAQEEVEAVVLLTRVPPVEYEPYIERVATSGNVLAIEVKIADLDDNLDPRRGPQDEKQATRYRAARLRLTGPEG